MKKKLLELVENGDFTNDDIADTLEAFQSEFDDKVNSCCKVLNSINADISTIDAEIERLKQIKQLKQGAQKRVKGIILQGFDIKGVKSYKTALYHLSSRKGVESVKITNEKSIPDEYVSTTIKYAPDKKLIKEALESGKKIEGAEMTTGDRSLTIK